MATESIFSRYSNPFLPGLSGRLTHIVQKMLESPTSLDEEALKKCMNDVTCALLDADFPSSRVNELERKIQEIINLPVKRGKERRIYQIIVEELCSMLDPGKSALIQENHEPSIVMFIGLRGVKKTDTCAEYARYHQKKGFKPALVCADTDAFDRLKKAAKDVYGSCTSDPDLIIVDTSGCHTLCSALFDEMRQLAEAMKPDLVLYVMDSSIGQAAAFDQTQAFKQSFAAGIIVLTNINGYSKAGGALYAVAAAKCPMILADETGEKIKEFEAFDVKPFVMGLLNHRLYTLRRFYEINQVHLGLRKEPIVVFPLAKPASGPQAHLMRCYLTIMDAMTDEELDRPDIIKQMSVERVVEIAKASKVEVREVVEMLRAFKKKAKTWKENEGLSRRRPSART